VSNFRKGIQMTLDVHNNEGRGMGTNGGTSLVDWDEIIGRWRVRLDPRV